MDVDRARGALLGVAIGDAMGMPTAFFTPAQIKERFGSIRTFVAPPSDHPYHAGLQAGQVTDDTGQTLAVARALLHRSTPLATAVAEELLRWAAELGGLDAPGIGPSTRKALKALDAGVPPEVAGADGDTNGASMRIAPVPIALGSRRGALPDLVDTVVQACLPTHGTSVAISGASAVAAGIAACLNGETDIDVILDAARQAADLGRSRGRAVIGPSVARRISLAQTIIAAHPDPQTATAEIYDMLGAGLATAEAVPAAFGIFAVSRADPVQAILLAANMGGDCDTVASIAGAIAGARAGAAAFPAEWIDTVERVNRLDLSALAAQVSALAEAAS